MPVSLVPLSETHITGRQREAISPSSDPSPGQRGVGDERQAFPREVIDDRQDAETSAVGESIRQEVQAPALIGTLRQRHRRPGAERPLAAAAAPNLQPFLAVEPAQLLVVHDNALRVSRMCSRR